MSFCTAPDARRITTSGNIQRGGGHHIGFHKKRNDITSQVEIMHAYYNIYS